ncbi:MAG: hypothetical protein D4R93_03915 [Deltaproteobacteria bacterium]|nr:MAG: hypothetical protein D4R93_03915 [Deltaproteobacteria bacterium]
MVEENDDKNVLDDLLKGAGEKVDPLVMDKLITKVDELKESGKNVESKAVAKKAYGLDIGTSRIVSIRQDDQTGVDQLNAFIAVPETQFLKDMLVKSSMTHARIRDEIVVLGYDALQFANIFNSEIRRPMKKGIITSEEIYAIPILKEIINLVLPRATEMAQPLCFSVPAPETGLEADLIFHETILKKYLVGMGYKSKSINEGMAVVVSELAGDNYTGIGISMGAGMCNVCFSFLSVPVLIFSLGRGGDDVDTSVARMMHETVNRVRVIKEESLDFSRTPKNNLENALIIYYEDLIMTLLSTLSGILSRAEKLPRLNKAIPIVLAGGTCLPNGFIVKFGQILKEIPMPIAISSVRLAHDPLRATARGALISASV